MKFVLVVFEISVIDLENCLSLLYSDQGRFRNVFYTFYDLAQSAKFFRKFSRSFQIVVYPFKYSFKLAITTRKCRYPHCRWISQFCIVVAWVESQVTKIVVLSAYLFEGFDLEPRSTE